MRRTAALVAVTAVLVAGACSSTRGRVASPTTTTTAPPAAAPAACTAPAEENVRSFAPGNITADAVKGKLVKAEVLTVGVSADTYLMGYRNPQNAELEGFDIDLVKEIAKALDVPVEYRVMPYARRIDALVPDEVGKLDGVDEVDVVAHTFTINCDRWTKINFSAEYLRAGQKLLVGKDDADAGVTTLDQMKGRRVCVTAGGTAEENLRANHGGVTPVSRTDLTDCMLAFQRGDADGIVSDDTVLAGFAAQDPYAKVVGDAFTAEPYGVGARKENPELTRFVNRVLENLRGARWAEIFGRTLGRALPPASPPAPTYGRTP
jgi:polar amino acid transport system substrate-binding protein